MNSLSWLLYFADILPAMAEAWSVIAFFALLGWIAITVVRLFEDDPANANTKDNPFQRGWYTHIPKIQQLFFWTATILGIVSYSIPSKDTFYLIIASEGAEVIVTDESAKKMFQDVQSIVSLQLQEMIDEKKDDLSNNNNRNNNNNNGN
jgi:hypothetical protein